MRVVLPSYNFNFKGINIAKAVVKNHPEQLEFDVYKMTDKDQPFLTDLYEHVDLMKLYPGLDYYHYHFWNHVLKKSIKMDNKEKVLLVAKDNKPCGLINYKEDKNSIFVNHVCSIPTGISEKVPWVGTVLFMSLFNDFLKKTLKQIRLSAAKDAPFPTIPKYERLGFQSIDEDAYHSTMVLKKESVESSLAKREKDVEYTEINNSKDIDLYDKLQFSKDMENLFKRYY